jgi:hypothetical protein
MNLNGNTLPDSQKTPEASKRDFALWEAEFGEPNMLKENDPQDGGSEAWIDQARMDADRESTTAAQNPALEAAQPSAPAMTDGSLQRWQQQQQEISMTQHNPEFVLRVASQAATQYQELEYAAALAERAFSVYADEFTSSMPEQHQQIITPEETGGTYDLAA